MKFNKMKCTDVVGKTYYQYVEENPLHSFSIIVTEKGISIKGQSIVMGPDEMIIFCDTVVDALHDYEKIGVIAIPTNKDDLI